LVLENERAELLRLVDYSTRLQIALPRSIGLLRNRTLSAGIILLALVLVLCAAAPLARYSPISLGLEETLQAPSALHWFGTDELGRDVLARLLYGGRTDLALTAVVVTFSFIVGSAVGCLAGYSYRWFDIIVMRVVDTVTAFPLYVLYLIIVFFIGGGIGGIVAAIALVDWVNYARLARGEVLRVKDLDYVRAARVSGLSPGRILSRHILPNILSSLVVFAMADAAGIVVVIGFLSYIGLGVPPPTPEWGAMVAQGQTFLTTDWMLATLPGLAIAVTALALSLIADGLTDAWRPT
jgi:peptide/nickel transport system permease protein